MKDISPDRWRQVEELVDRALDLDPAEREPFLLEACADDEELGTLVRKMLSAGEQADTFLESGGEERREALVREISSRIDETEENRLRIVGPYRIVRKLGRGGMGQVFLAVRDDEAFRKYVAIKVIRRGMDTEDILRRFRTERQILASLTHPNIARLLDGGVTEDGLSYFVMDYVDGTEITDYCDQHRLTLDERLDLFEQVCSAVHYAHQNLIVHRDLKPGNILVQDDGSVKLLDFGIAKFLNSDLAGFTTPMTRPEMRVMTPEYASPEQVRGKNVTTASDVYQLGILLYELLTGHRPFSFETRARDEIEKIILEQDPVRPSTAITKLDPESGTDEAVTAETVGLRRGTPVERLRKQLSGDLDHIVLMALRKETDERYRSADQLLEDVRRYRDGLPVHAQAPTFGYRALKFVRRHKGGVTAAAVVAVSLMVATFVAVRSALVTAAQAEQIRIEAAKTEEVKNYVVGLFERANPAYVRGRDLTPRDLLALGTEDILADLDEQPEVRAEILATIGMVFADLGEFEEARPLIEEAYDMRRRLAGDDETADLAESMYQMGYIIDETAESEDAIPYYEQALEMQIRIHGEESLPVARTKNELGASLFYIEDYDRARTLWNQALETRRALLGDEHIDIAETLANLAAVYTNLGFPAEDEMLEAAEQAHLQSLEMVRTLEGDDHPLVASNLYNLGTLMIDTGEPAEGLSYVEEALAIRRQIYGERHDEVARAINYMGRAYHRMGEYERAQTMFEQSLDIHREVFGPVSFYTGVDLKQLADLARDRGEFSRAEDLYEQAVETLSEAVSDDHTRTAGARLGLATVYAELGRHEAAVEQARETLRVYLDTWGEDDPDVNSVRILLARSLIAAGGSTAEARDLLAGSLEYFREKGDDERVAEIESLLEALPATASL